MSSRFQIYLVLLFSVFLLGLFNFRKLSKPFKLLTLFILITFISESLTRYFAKEFRNSSPIYHTYYPIHFFFITTFYSYYLKKNIALISWSAPLFVVIALINARYYQATTQFPSNIVLISSLIYVLCALALFKNMLSAISKVSLLRQELFWYNLTTIITYTFTFLCWSFYNILLKTNNNSTVIDIIYYLALQYYIMVGISIILNVRRQSNQVDDE